MPHRVLNRQLKKLGLTPDRLPESLEQWQLLLERIEQAYHDADQDRYLLERSLAISSREMQALHDNLRSRLTSELDRLRAVIDSLGAGLCLLRPDGAVLSVNPEGRHLMGYAEDEEVLGLPVATFLPALAGRPDRLDAPFREEDGHLRRKDGTMLPVTYTLNPLGEGRALRGAVLVFFDISEHRRAEQALDEQRAFLRQIIDINPHMIFAKDRESRFILVNQAVAEVYGTTVEALIGKTDADFNDNPDEVANFRRDDLRVLDTLEEQFIPEEPITDAEGRRRWLSTIKRPLLGPDGRADRLLGVATDITERKEAAEARERYARELEAAKRAVEAQAAQLTRMVDQLEVAKLEAETSARLKAHILDNMSHEIRTPITSILGYAQLLAEELGEQHHEFVSYIRTNGQRLLGTLNSILDLSRIETGRVQLHPHRVSLGAAARSCAALFKPIAAECGIGLRVEERVPSVEASVDEAALDRILQNLVSNALKFTEEGEVVIGVAREGGQAVLTVRDTGIGIGDAFMPYLFEEFRQESAGLARSHEGSGLGLAITHRLVEAMQGTIAVESVQGRGTLFTVRFPALPAPRSQPVPRAAAPDADQSSSATPTSG